MKLRLYRLLRKGINEIVVCCVIRVTECAVALRDGVRDGVRPDVWLVSWKLEPGFHLILHELGAELEPPITILVENRGMMLKRDLATIE